MFHFPLPTDKILPEKIECKSPQLNRVNQTILDCIKGSLVGLVVGDMVEASTEYVHDSPLGNRSARKRNLELGQWTGSTSMALCLASSLTTQHTFNPYDQLVRYKWWYKYGYLSPTGNCFDIDNVMRDSLDEFCRRQTDLNIFYGYLTEDKLDSLPNDEIVRSAGFDLNCSRQGVHGSAALVRLAPIPLLYYRTPAVAVELSGLSARLTHGDDRIVDVCRYFGALMTAAIRGESKEALLSHRFYDDHRDWFDWKDIHPSIRSVVLGSYKQRFDPRNGVRPTNDIIETLETVLWTFWTDCNSFQKGLLDSISLNPNKKNIAAIYGQLAGAYYGYNRIPTQWIQQMYAQKLIINTAEWLYFLSERTTFGLGKPNEIQKTVISPSRWQSSNLVEVVTQKHIHPKMIIDKVETQHDSSYVILPKLVFLAFIFNSIAINGSDCPNQQWIEKSFEKVHVPGATILVVNVTHILYEQAFGFESLLPLKPIDIDKSIFPIASISKTFIATAVMQLVEQELVDLDTDINDYLLEPQKRIFHPRYPLHSITLRKLLSHSASIHIN
ncbi:unnamed protein product [Rotaria magnacalcarata]